MTGAPLAEAAALSYAAGVVRRHDPDRFLCALFAPADRREALFALYALNHELAKIAEVVSEPMAGLIRLQWWRDAVEAVHGAAAAGGPAHPVLDGLRAALARHPLPRGPFERLIEGREFDLERQQPPSDLDAFEGYLEATSSSLTRLALGVLGAASGPSLEAGRRVGLAWGLTGQLRALPFHAAQGRLYLPADLLRRHGVDPRAVLRGDDGEGLRGAVAELAGRAHEHLAAARAYRGELPAAALPALLPAALADAYLRRLRRSGYAPFAADLRRRPPLAPLALLLRRLAGRF